MDEPDTTIRPGTSSADEERRADAARVFCERSADRAIDGSRDAVSRRCWMLFETRTRRWWLAAALTALAVVAVPRVAHAQGFISPSFGYAFGGDTGCRSATDCKDKNWNWGSLVRRARIDCRLRRRNITRRDRFTGRVPSRRRR
jgi:hypothetical protein